MRRGADPDRYLTLKGQRYHYKRRVPTSVHAIVGGDTHVRKSLKTGDLAIARIKRDEREEADDRLWEALALGKPAAGAKAAYEAAVATALALRFAYKPTPEIVDAPLTDLLGRITAVPEGGSTRPVADATLGFYDVPKPLVSDAFDTYADVIATDELRGKSAKQRADWRKVKERARNNFIKIVGDVPLSAITRDQALQREDPRQIKTGTSVRKVPLLGVSLAAMKASPKGFPEYHDSETTLSNTLMKHFRKHKLLPTPAHTIYSIRHAFEDRMKDAHVDEELRKLLMGHALDRPRYGARGSLELRREALTRITLPFDASIV